MNGSYEIVAKPNMRNKEYVFVDTRDAIENRMSGGMQMLCWLVKEQAFGWTEVNNDEQGMYPVAFAHLFTQLESMIAGYVGIKLARLKRTNGRWTLDDGGERNYHKNAEVKPKEKAMDFRQLPFVLDFLVNNVRSEEDG